MHDFLVGLLSEYLKIIRSKVLWITVGSLCLAPIFGAMFVIVLRNPELTAGNEALRAKAALTGFSPDWPAYLNLLVQAFGIGGILVFGFVGSWVFGREHSDRTMKDLLTSPVSRGTLVAAKATAVFLWCAFIVACVTVVGLLVGSLLGLPGWSACMLLQTLRRIAVTFGLVMCLCPPVFWMAGLGRGYLAPLGFVVGCVVVSQIVGALGFGAWFPWAVPALYGGIGAVSQGGLGLLNYLLLPIVGCVGWAATLHWWKYTDHT